MPSRFLGLRNPASAIRHRPERSYLRNPFRIVGDVGRPTVPILAAEASSFAPLELSLAVSRAVSPVRLEYLRNKRFAASLSISIVVEGRLWGLIAVITTNRGSRRSPGDRRSASELFAQMYSMMLEGRLCKAEIAAGSEARSYAERLVGSITGERHLLGDASWLHAVLREMIACDGIAVSLNGEITTSGLVPAVGAIVAIVDNLREQTPAQVFATHELDGDRNRLVVERPDVHSAVARAARQPDPVPPTSAADHALGRAIRQKRPSRRARRAHLAAQELRGLGGPARRQSLPFSMHARLTAEFTRSGLINVLSLPPDARDDGGRRVADLQELLITELNQSCPQHPGVDRRTHQPHYCCSRTT